VTWKAEENFVMTPYLGEEIPLSKSQLQLRHSYIISEVSTVRPREAQVLYSMFPYGVDGGWLMMVL
jgi:hypothetical protein